MRRRARRGFPADCSSVMPYASGSLRGAPGTVKKRPGCRGAERGASIDPSDIDEFTLLVKFDGDREPFL